MNEQRDELKLDVLVDQIVFDRPATHLREASYSTEIEAAFEVEAVMRARGFQMRLRGAASLSEMALRGVKHPEDCKFSVTLPEITLTEAIEVIPCTAEAVRNIQAVPEWVA